jgi:hypothetical protein
MEQVIAHLTRYSYIYGISIACIVILVIAVMNITTYETLVLRNMAKTFFFPRKEGYQNQNQDVVTSGMKIADTLTREHCEKLKDQIDAYEKVKVTHKDVPIKNLDETLTLMKDYFVSYNCE